jgi:hypothetical protein
MSRLIGIAIVVSIALLYCEPVATGQTRGPGVTLTLSSEKSTYSLTDDLSLTASLRNQRSIDPVFVPSYIGWGTGAGIDLRIEDMQGKQARGNLTLDNMPLPFPESDDGWVAHPIPISGFGCDFHCVDAPFSRGVLREGGVR